MKKLFATFAMAGMIGLVGCQSDAGETEIMDEPVLEEPTTAPAVTEPVAPPPPMMTDTMTTDTAGMMEDTAATLEEEPAQ